jgi:hypothetical protein
MVSKSVRKPSLIQLFHFFCLRSRYKLKRSKQEPSSSYQQSIQHVPRPDEKFLYTSSSYNAYMSSFGYHQYSTNNSYENLFRQQPQTTSWS